jgi:DNA-binding response OmpR family regulator
MTVVCAVLVIEPSDLFREFLDVIVEHAGYDVVAVDLSETAQQALAEQRFDVVILASSGVGGRVDPLLARRAADTGVAVIIVLDDIAHRRAFAKDGYAMIEKPFMPATLIDALEQLRRRNALQCEPRPQCWLGGAPHPLGAVRREGEGLRRRRSDKSLPARCGLSQFARANRCRPPAIAAATLNAMTYTPRSRTWRRAPGPWRRRRARAASV